MEYKSLIVTHENGVAKVTMNLPETMNAMSDDLLADLRHVTGSIARDPDIRCMILTGSGKAFCAGGDLRRFQQGFTLFGGIQYVDDVHEWIMELIHMNKPTIAAVNGYAMGAGFCIALLCDMILASESAKFGQSFVNVGIVPDMAGLYYLPRLIGLQRAKELAFTGRTVDAREAYEQGFINRVVAHDTLDAQADALAQQIAQGPALAIAATKKILNMSFDLSLKELVEMESYVQGAMFQTEDSKEAINAFLEKRKPKFQGR